LNSVENVKFEGEPIEAIKVILSKAKMNSVGLQNLAKKIMVN
jgi:hypothetical protein